MRRITLITAVVFLAASCSSSKKIAEQPVIEKKAPAILVPEGIEFKTVENHQDFALINLPLNGSGFKENTDYVDADFPVLSYESYQFIVRSNLKDFEGSLEEQFEKLKRTLYFKVNPEEEVTFEKSIIGDYETALIKIYKESSGYKFLKYGYLISHNNKAAAFFIKDGYFTPEQDVEPFIATLDETMQYMIKTCKFN